ncbi:TPA: hypothetical protein NDU38_000942 [Pseudomonas aeruginosa]|nr:hypothetical protein [Pseudomonas aeruginosa]
MFKSLFYLGCIPLAAAIVEIAATPERNNIFLTMTRGDGPQTVTVGYELLFKQESHNTCGAAALAYFLTRIGNLVFEHEITSKFPMKNTVGYSANDLTEIAKTYGINSSVLYEQLDNLPKFGEIPRIAHMNAQHYTLVLGVNERDIIYFDPSYGKIFSIPKKEFNKVWSGVTIKFSFPSVKSDLFLPTGKVK